MFNITSVFFILHNPNIYNKTISIAVEYSKQKENKTTFHDKGQYYMFQEIKKVKDYHKNDNIFISIHNIAELMKG